MRCGELPTRCTFKGATATMPGLSYLHLFSAPVRAGAFPAFPAASPRCALWGCLGPRSLAGWARSRVRSPLEAGGRALGSLDCGRRGQINDAGGRAVPAELSLLGGGWRGEERRWNTAAVKPGPQ